MLARLYLYICGMVYYLYDKMPYGKYEGKRLDELPESYINWLLEAIGKNIPTRRGAVNAAIYKCLKQWQDSKNIK